MEGASGIRFAVLIEQLGIAREVQPKALRQPSSMVGELVAGATPSLAIQQIPELMAVSGITYFGPMPTEPKKVSETSAAILASQPRGGLLLGQSGRTRCAE